MRIRAFFSQEGLVQLKRHHLYGLIALYRWLALSVPGLALGLSGPPQLLTAGLLGLAFVNTLLQTAFYFKLRSSVQKDFVHQSQLPAQERGRRQMLAAVVVELLVASLLNSPPDSPYYLYSLAAIFSTVFFGGLGGALASALILSISFLAARLSLFVVSGNNLEWSAIITSLTCFFLVAALSGTLLAVSYQLRNYATVIGRYRGNLERQNQSLEQTNQQLEYLSDFNRVIQGGNTSAEVEQLALGYLARLLASRRVGLGSGIDTIQNHSQPLQLLKNEELRQWLPTPPGPGPLGRIIKVGGPNQSHWLVPLVYKGDQFGALLVPRTAGDESEERREETLLVSLLADQLAYALGSLKQTQALAVEAERTRLAMDMHDVVAQSLFGIAFNLDACIKLLDRDIQAACQRLNDLRGLAFDTLGSVRAIIYDLSNEESGEVDFASFLQAFIRKAGSLYPFRLDLRVESEPGLVGGGFKLEQDSQKSLYRLVQEALSNAAKHSGASEVQLLLRRTRSHLQLEIKDNGRGFEVVPDAGESSLAFGGMGLQTMRERAEAASGTLQVESQPGQGTRLKVEVPLKDF